MLGFAPLASIPIADDGYSPEVIYLVTAGVSGAASVEAVLEVLRTVDGPLELDGVGSVSCTAGKTYSVDGPLELDGAGSVSISVDELIELSVMATAGSSTASSGFEITLNQEPAISGEAHVTVLLIRGIIVDGPCSATGAAYVGIPGDPYVETLLDHAPTSEVQGAASTFFTGWEVEYKPILEALGQASYSIGGIIPVEEFIEITDLPINGVGSIQIFIGHEYGNFSAAGQGESAVEISTTELQTIQSLELNGIGSVDSDDVHLFMVTGVSTRANTNNWTNEVNSTQNIYTSISEPYPPNDSTYIRSPALTNSDPLGQNITISSYDFNLAHLSNPVSNNHHRLKARIKRVNDGFINARIYLYCGNTQITSWSYNNVDTDWLDIDEPISANVAVNINDYSQVWVRITAELGP